jgi:hypothetical protein
MQPVILQVLATAVMVPALLVHLSGCNESGGCGPCPGGSQVVVTSPDTTPPDFVGLLATFAGETHPNVSGGETASVAGDDVVSFVASGGDPEGVREIRIWVEETHWRELPNGLNEQVGPGLLAAPETNFAITANPGETVCTPIRVTHEVRIASRRRDFDRMRLVIRAEAVNFSGLAAISSITLNWN